MFEEEEANCIIIIPFASPITFLSYLSPKFSTTLALPHPASNMPRDCRMPLSHWICDVTEAGDSPFVLSSQVD